MRLIKGVLIASAVLVTALAATAAMSPSEAQRACRARIAGEGSGMGIGGVGTENAKKAATADWSKNAAAKHGARYGDFNKAKGVRFDCRSGFVLEVKCALSAQPCR